MLDYYTLQATLEKLTTADHTFTATDIATLCRAGKLTPLFAYNRYATEILENSALSKSYDITSTSPLNGYLTHRQTLDLLDSYSESVKLSEATVIYDGINEANGCDVILLDQPFNYYRYQSDDNYNPVADSEPLRVTIDQLLFKREEVEALVSNTQSSQPLTKADKTQGDALLILGAVMECIDEVAKKNYTQQILIDAILAKYGNTTGISESTLKKKFPEAKKHLNQRFTP